MSKTKFTRQELIEHLEKCIIPEKKWRNRDSASAHRQLGECLALIKAGCDFKVFLGNGRVWTNSTGTLEIQVSFMGFNAFEYGEGHKEADEFYAPTIERLENAKGGDWY